MYGVTNDIDLSSFMGARLDQIGLGLHHLQFHFDPTCSICVEGEWELIGSDGVTIDRSLNENQKPSDRKEYRLHYCLGRVVVKTAVEPPKSISLTFEEGFVLRIIDNSTHYESFQIEPGGIIV